MPFLAETQERWAQWSRLRRKRHGPIPPSMRWRQIMQGWRVSAVSARRCWTTQPPLWKANKCGLRGSTTRQPCAPGWPSRLRSTRLILKPECPPTWSRSWRICACWSAFPSITSFPMRACFPMNPSASFIWIAHGPTGWAMEPLRWAKSDRATRRTIRRTLQR